MQETGENGRVLMASPPAPPPFDCALVRSNIARQSNFIYSFSRVYLHGMYGQYPCCVRALIGLAPCTLHCIHCPCPDEAVLGLPVLGDLFLASNACNIHPDAGVMGMKSVRDPTEPTSLLSNPTHASYAVRIC